MIIKCTSVSDDKVTSITCRREQHSLYIMNFFMLYKNYNIMQVLFFNARTFLMCVANIPAHFFNVRSEYSCQLNLRIWEGSSKYSVIP